MLNYIMVIPFVGGSLVPLDEATAVLGLGLSGSCHDINTQHQAAMLQVPAHPRGLLWSTKSASPLGGPMAAVHPHGSEWGTPNNTKFGGGLGSVPCPSNSPVLLA